MRIRFRRSIRVMPGVKINLNKKSVGLTVGRRSMHYTVNSKGQRTTSVGLPGTGLSVQHTSGRRRQSESAVPAWADAFRSGALIIGAVVIIVVLVAILH